MKVLNYSAYAKYFNLLFTDSADVYRYGEVIDTDGTTNNVLSDLPILENVACRLSFSSKDSASRTEEYNEERTGMKIFCALDVYLQNGDFLQIRRMHDSQVLGLYQGQIGRPALYETRGSGIFTNR